VWNASEQSIWQIEGINKLAVRSFLGSRSKMDLDGELNGVLEGNIKVLTLEDEEYPENLKNIYDPPPVLYIRGKIEKSDQKALAIVGTRRASRYGLEIARKLACELAALGITIVSGMAMGIDSAAHRGALEAKGRTIAVFGTGVDEIFPSQNKELAGQIAFAGALVSEFPLGTKGEKGNFPRRNRIISGLSLGVIVVEGHYDSGAMITAKEALEQGREVFAVPGNVELDQSKGPHWLIKQGAKLVESVQDVLEELNMVMPKKMTNDPLDFARGQMSNEGRNYPELNEEEKKIVSVLSLEPKHLDVISMETKLSIPQVSSTLMMLEIKKVVRQLPGKMFVLS
jgi:DNA processing protein